MEIIPNFSHTYAYTRLNRSNILIVIALGPTKPCFMAFDPVDKLQNSFINISQILIKFYSCVVWSLTRWAYWYTSGCQSVL